jgi:hypothetical protein
MSEIYSNKIPITIIKNKSTNTNNTATTTTTNNNNNTSKSDGNSDFLDIENLDIIDDETKKMNQKRILTNGNSNGINSSINSTTSRMTIQQKNTPASLALSGGDSQETQTRADTTLNGTNNDLTNLAKSSNTSSVKIHHRYETLLLKELMLLNIKKEKIEMALAATGYQKSIDAINWLMKHSKDPLLMQDTLVATRDYIILLCPVNRLATQINNYFQQSKIKCGVNEAHYNNALPFIKLTSFFKVNFNVCLFI